MEIKLINLGELKVYERNAKKHPLEQVKKIAESIKKFGFNQPIVVDKNNIIVVGHGRYEAAKVLDMQKVPCVMANDLLPEEIKAYRLADNKLNESSWDMDLVMEELEGLDEELKKLAGFSVADFEDIDFDNIESNEDREKQFKDQLITCPHCEKTFNIKI